MSLVRVLGRASAARLSALGRIDLGEMLRGVLQEILVATRAAEHHEPIRFPRRAVNVFRRLAHTAQLFVRSDADIQGIARPFPGRPSSVLFGDLEQLAGFGVGLALGRRCVVVVLRKGRDRREQSQRYGEGGEV